MAYTTIRRPVAVLNVAALLFALLVTGCTTAPSVQAAPANGPAPVPAARTIFYDNFTSVKGEWQQWGGSWEVFPSEINGNGVLAQKTDDPAALNAIKFIETPRVADATIETALVMLPRRPYAETDNEADRQMRMNIRYYAGAGIIFRAKNDKNYYMFRLAGEEGAVLGKMIDGVWTDLQNPRFRDVLESTRIGFDPSNWYRLKIEVYGNRIVCSVNDEPIINVTDDTFSTGRFGLVTFKTAARFDYIKVTNRQESEIKTQ